MKTITFYPLGNADSYLIGLDNQKRILFDYAAMRDGADSTDKRIDLPKALKDDIGWPSCRELDVVAISHIDNDHVKGFSDFFYLEHAKEYQGSERVKIKELWVTASVIVEKGTEDDSRVVRQEARERLKKGKGIIVFSRPDRLKEWLENEGISPESRRSLIIDAGNTVPTFSKENDGVEFFVHSPFASHDNGEDRNENSLVMQCVFSEGTRMLLTGDVTHDVLEKIVDKSLSHGREDRLRWDFLKVPHHCSYKALSDEKGKRETEPTEQVRTLLAYAEKGARAVMTCKPINEKDQDDNPPHIQAKRCYENALNKVGGEATVTMEYPSQESPDRLKLEVTWSGLRLIAPATIGVQSVYTHHSPRMG
jgi:metal-dependent hydrolase (beta-lactamase superfamily II)